MWWMKMLFESSLRHLALISKVKLDNQTTKKSKNDQQNKSFAGRKENANNDKIRSH